LKIRTVTVLGANGNMGCKVSGIFASFGNAKVYMVCRSIEDANEARMKAATSVKAESIAKNLIPKTYNDLEECIENSDLVFESVAENAVIKQEVYEKITRYLTPDTVIGTGTSGLSINVLSSYFDDKFKKNFIGIHMYNPPYNMILCEVIPSKYTDETLLREVKEYLKTILYRKVVEVKDESAFVGNRIGFQFINQALQYAEQYKDNGGIDYIDSILGPFTGRNMPPIYTSDFVGLDIHKAIVDNIFYNTNDYVHNTFKIPDFCIKLIEEKRLGKKTGCGLYQTAINSDGNRIFKVYDIANERYRIKENYVFPFSKQMIKYFKKGSYASALDILMDNQSIEANICKQFLIHYVLYSITTAKAIGENIYAADDAMANGFNWIPPLAFVDAMGGCENFKKIALTKLPKTYLSIINLDKILEDVPKSKYDYRPFLKAK
jgi:3-hydroxyacyl-CoA dehydrogenase